MTQLSLVSLEDLENRAGELMRAQRKRQQRERGTAAWGIGTKRSGRVDVSGREARTAGRRVSEPWRAALGQVQTRQVQTSEWIASKGR